MDSKKLQETLCVLANKLNQKKIHWVLGGSMLMYIKNIVSEVQDLDIMIDEKDKAIVQSILQQIGQPIDIISSDRFISKVFMKYLIKDVSVDVIGGFIISTKEQEYYFPLEPKDYETYLLNGETIYLDSLETWAEYYRLMGRESSYQKIIESVQAASEVLSK